MYPRMHLGRDVYPSFSPGQAVCGTEKGRAIEVGPVGEGCLPGMFLPKWVYA